MPFLGLSLWFSLFVSENGVIFSRDAEVKLSMADQVCFAFGIIHVEQFTAIINHMRPPTLFFVV